MPRTLRRCLAALLSFALIALSPGLAPYEAAARDMSSHGAGTVSVGLPRLSPSAVVPGLTRRLDAVPTFTSLRPADHLQAVGAAKTDARPQVDAAAAPESSAAAGVSAETARLTTEVSSLVDGLGDVSNAPAGQARESAGDVQALIGRERRVESTGMVFAKPAGRDSIGVPAAILAGRVAAPQGPSTTQNEPPQPPAPPITPNGGGDGRGSGPERAPLVPRILTSLATLAPAVVIGWPLLSAAAPLAFVMGVLTMIASATLAVMPFLTEKSSVVARALPGFFLLGVGAAAVASGVMASAIGPVIMGAAVLAGAFGFLRFALGRSSASRHDSWLTVFTFLGAVAAVTGAGLSVLALAAVPSLIAVAAMYAAYPIMVFTLYMHLPGWVGAAIEQAMHAVYVSVQDAFHVATSISSDTSAGKRLSNFTDAAIERSTWNVIWIGLVVWLPVLAVEGVKAALGGIIGLINGAIRAPLFALWGASHKKWPQSGLTRFFAGWARGASAFNKVSTFNALEEPFIAGANSDFRLKRLGSELAISFVQALWLVASPFVQVIAVLAGLRNAAAEAAKPYDEKTHDPRRFSLAHDPLRDAVPAPPKPNVTLAWPGKAIATLVGLAPLWFATALLAEGFLGWAAIASIVTVGLMPLMPTKGLPGMIRKLPALLLMVTGAFGAVGAVNALLMGLPGMGPIIALSVLAAFGGAGMSGMIDSIEDPNTKTYKLDQAPYILGFAAAVAMIAALGASFTGLAGAALTALLLPAFILSPALLYHLPRSFWSGLRSSIYGLYEGIGSVGRVMFFWGGSGNETKFADHLGDWLRHYTSKSWWNGIWFLPVGVALLAVSLVDVAVALAGGVVVGVVRVPQRFLWGSSYRRFTTRQYKLEPAQRNSAEDAWWPRFWAGFNKFLIDPAEGSKKTAFDAAVKRLVPYMNEQSEKTSRPSFMAALAFVGSWFVQAYWLLRVAVLLALTPVVLLPAAAFAWMSGFAVVALVLAGLSPLLFGAAALAGRKAANKAVPVDLSGLDSEIRPAD